MHAERYPSSHSFRRRVWAVVMAIAPAAAVADTPPPAPPPINAIVGQVVDHEGQPVPGSSVALANADRGYLLFEGGEAGVRAFGDDRRVLIFFRARNGLASATVQTNEQGWYEVTNLMAGPFHAAAYHPERGAVLLLNLDMPEGGRELPLRLDAPTFLEGKVVGLSPIEPLTSITSGYMPSARLVGRAAAERVFLSPSLPYTQSEGEGSFRVGPLPTADGWSLQIERYVLERGFAASIVHAPITIRPGETNRFHLDLTAGEVIAGQVLGPDKQPLKDVSVVARSVGDVDRLIGTLTNAETPEQRSDAEMRAAGRLIGTLTDAEGKYRISGLAPGRYELEAKR